MYFLPKKKRQSMKCFSNGVEGRGTKLYDRPLYPVVYSGATSTSQLSNVLFFSVEHFSEPSKLVKKK